MRQQREACELSQTQLGEKLSVSFQQVQKYERGTNRLSASAMWAACQALEVEPNYFFEGLSHD
jgi:transcriptional regulator with XRE-family HTH domain